MDQSPGQRPEQLEVGEDHQGQRLDRLVADWRGLSRAAVLRLLECGALDHNGRALSQHDKGMAVTAGDVVSLDARFAQGEVILSDASLAVDVLGQGDGWIAVNKPAGMPVRPHALDEAGTVLSALVADRPEIMGVGEGGLRSGVVHRLDNKTSGVLLVATEQSAWQKLRKMFSDHTIEKRYTALVHGTPEDEGSLTLPLRVAQHSPAKVAVCSRAERHVEARDCSLSWTIIQRFNDRASLVAVDLHTGFLHQVRVMMAHLGCPVVGDAVYGDGFETLGAERQMLHAASLGIEDQLIEAPLPVDMQRVIDCLDRD